MPLGCVILLYLGCCIWIGNNGQGDQVDCGELGRVPKCSVKIRSQSKIVQSILVSWSIQYTYFFILPYFSENSPAHLCIYVIVFIHTYMSIYLYLQKHSLLLFCGGFFSCMFFIIVKLVGVSQVYMQQTVKWQANQNAQCWPARKLGRQEKQMNLCAKVNMLQALGNSDWQSLNEH